MSSGEIQPAVPSASDASGAPHAPGATPGGSQSTPAVPGVTFDPSSTQGNIQQPGTVLTDGANQGMPTTPSQYGGSATPVGPPSGYTNVPAGSYNTIQPDFYDPQSQGARPNTPIAFSNYNTGAGAFQSQAQSELESRMAIIARDAVREPMATLAGRIDSLIGALGRSQLPYSTAQAAPAPQPNTQGVNLPAPPTGGSPWNLWSRLVKWSQPTPVTRTVPPPPVAPPEQPSAPPQESQPIPQRSPTYRSPYQPGSQPNEAHPINAPYAMPFRPGHDNRFPTINASTFGGYSQVPVPPPRAIEAVVPFNPSSYDERARAAGYLTAREITSFGRDALKEARSLYKQVPRFLHSPTDSLYYPYTWMCKMDKILRGYLTSYPTAATGLTEAQLIELVMPQALEVQAWQWYQALAPNDPAKNSIYEFWCAFARTFICTTLPRNMMDELRSLRVDKFSSLHQYTMVLDIYLRGLHDLRPTLDDDTLFDIIRHHMTAERYTKLVVDHRCETYQDIRLHWAREVNATRGAKPDSTFIGSLNLIRRGTMESLPFLATTLADNGGRAGDLVGESVNSIGYNLPYDEGDSGTFYDCEESLTCTLCHMNEVPTPSHCAVCDSLYYDDSPEEFMDYMYSHAPSHFANIAPISARCSHCNKQGHFCRDCPDLGGSGKSMVGQRFGTARGFKEGDDPSQRPQHYKDAVARRHRAFLARNKGKKGPMKAGTSRNKGGKMATHARRLRTGHAQRPPQQSYLQHVNANVMMELCGDGLAHIEDSTDPESGDPQESVEASFCLLDSLLL